MSSTTDTQFIPPPHGKQNCLTTSSTNTSSFISTSSARSVNIFHSVFLVHIFLFNSLLFPNKFLLLDLSSNSSLQESPLGFIGAQTIPILPHLPHPAFFLSPSPPVVSHGPSPPSDKPISSNFFCVLLGELLLIFYHLSKRDLWVLDTAFHTEDWFLGERNTTVPRRQLR